MQRKKQLFLFSVGAVAIIGITNLNYTWASNFKNDINLKNENYNYSVEDKDNNLSSKDVNAYFFEMYGFTESDLRTEEYKVQLMEETTDLNSQSVKQLVYEKILNTTDYYQTVQGVYQRNEVYANNNYTMKYALDKTNGLTGGEKMITQDGNLDISYFSGTNGTRLLVEDGKEFERSGNGEQIQLLQSYYFDPIEAEQFDFVKMVKSQSRIQYDQEGTSQCFYRTTSPAILYARESIDPQEMGMGYLEQFENWNIEAVEQVAGRDCWKLVGTLSGEYAEKLHAYSYEMYVDCETGFVLQYSNFDQNGALTDHLTTLEIQVNQPVSQDTFNEIAKQYLNAYNTFWNLPLV